MSVSLLMLALLTAADAAPADTYARLHERLADFVAPGTEAGRALPMGWRHDGLGLGKWGDATVALGWSLTVHATEHALAPSPEVARALYEGLTAVERLDRDAALGFAPPCDPAPRLDGFFVRDDVPAEAHTWFDGLQVVQSDWIDPEPRLKEMSHDQVHHLVLGLVAVETLVPDDVTVEGRALAPWAAEAGARILERIAAADWTVTNPSCGDRLVYRGPSAAPLAPGLAGAHAALTDGPVVLDVGKGERDLWDLQRSPDFPGYGNPDNQHMAMVTGATGRGWGDDTLDVLVALSTTHDWVAYPLLHVVLYGPPASWESHRDELLSRAEAQLVELGDAEPFGPAEGERATHGWTSWHRYIRPASKHYDGGIDRVGRRFPGLDWMVLHNVWRLAQQVDDEVDADDTAASPDSLDTFRPVTDEAAGCGCGVGGAGAAGWAWLALPWWWRRRVRARG